MPLSAGFFNKKRFSRQEILSIRPSDLSMSNIYESLGITPETPNARNIAANALFKVVRAQSRQFISSRKALQQFERETGLTSAALERFGGTPYSRFFRQKNVSSSDWNKLIGMSAQYADFFGSKTATPEGVREVNRNTDKYLFGIDSEGKPLREMTAEERKLWGRVLSEYKKQYAEHFHSRQGSEPVMSYIAQIVIDNPHADMIALLNKTYYRFMDAEIDELEMRENHIAQNREYLQSQGIDTTYMSDTEIQNAVRSIIYDGPKW